MSISNDKSDYFNNDSVNQLDYNDGELCDYIKFITNLNESSLELENKCAESLLSDFKTLISNKPSTSFLSFLCNKNDEGITMQDNVNDLMEENDQIREHNNYNTIEYDSNNFVEIISKLGSSLDSTELTKQQIVDLARAYHAVGESKKLNQLCQQFGSKLNSNIYTCIMAANLYNSSKISEANEMLQRSNWKNDELIQAIMYYVNGDFINAIRMFAFVKSNSQDSLISNWLGASYYQQGLIDLSRLYFNECLSKAPDHVIALTNAAILDLKNKRESSDMFHRAVEILEPISKLVPHAYEKSIIRMEIASMQ